MKNPKQFLKNLEVGNMVDTRLLKGLWCTKGSQTNTQFVPTEVHMAEVIKKTKKSVTLKVKKKRGAVAGRNYCSYMFVYARLNHSFDDRVDRRYINPELYRNG